MLRSIVRKLLELLLFILLLSFISFCLLKLLPGDPVRSILRVDDVAVSNVQIEAMRTELGLNESLIVQYGIWLRQMLQLNLGDSYITSRPVITEFIEKLPYTLMLTLGSLLVMLIIAIPFGTLSAIYANRWIDKLSRLFSLLGSAMPSFWLGLLLIQLFAVKLQILPPMGEGSILHLIIPSLTLGIAMSAVYVRMIRASLIESAGQDFVASARARGIHPIRLFIFHTFRHSLVPLVTILSESIGSLLGGTVVIEVLFAYPGLGQWVVNAITARDYPVIQGYTLLMSCFVISINMAVEVSYRWINPQIARRGKLKS
ncbi:nickel ABC transporter permease [Paenibacillus sinopodophylli]|uniref:nickel ABC transporter permease n=1 Tax=Paenibacillus sinopodophylli TaxID=1837342 RepID=UPI00110CCBDC|nr:nickel ABC transporter permease [Paenibacillus sinopodophylli]